MATILSLETATRTCSVALHQDTALLGLQEVHLDKSHSSRLHVLIDDLLRYCEVERRQLDAVAVSIGPGSYTGLRIGVSAAKGIGFALDIPVIAVNTLAAMARSQSGSNVAGAWLCPMLDARRMEVYCQLLNQDGEQLWDTRPLIVDEGSFQAELNQHPILFFGDGSTKCRPLLEHHPNAYFAADVMPSARWVGELAQPKFERQEFEDLAYFVPLYLKEYRATQPKKNPLR